MFNALTNLKANDYFALLFITLFLYAATNKLIEYDLFVAQVGKSPLIAGFQGIIPWVIPSAEVLIAVVMFYPGLRLLGFYGFFTMMIAFSAYIITILNFSPYVPCSCGGILNSMGWTEHLVFNLAFAALGSVAIIFEAPNAKIKKHVSQSAL